ncbi:MAG: peptidyl-prolyl cis-trans isomerase [Candidatus Eisenbacteria bacterium]|uniref:Peptidyl-prolyl cis-trans isomerase n=1 Tax=Eiseniibacteriota bacterium TaxID=2212470 RepID=A0A933SCR1_UNCEI|nr:peptidyl-prolyl cis-trans isomerase [Candidatus Eisenbacteria bacterium]
MNARRGLSLLVIVACAAQAALVFAPPGARTARPAPAAASPAAPTGPAAATVGPRRIFKDDLDRRTAAAVTEFSQRSGNRELPPEMRDLVRRQVLESLIRQELFTLEANRTGVTASVAEAEEILKREPFFNPGGQFDPTRFNAVKTTQKASYDAAIASIRSQLAGRKLADRTASKYTPSEADARALAARTLMRVTAEHLTLRKSEFDGSYPEPREADVVAYYRSHQRDYERPDRAKLTVVFVNSPGLSDEQRRESGALDAWTKRMKVVADSLLAEVAKGAEFSSVVAWLSPRQGVVVTSDNFPGYWRGTAAQQKRLFDPRMTGVVFPEPIAGEEGWMIVRVDEVQPAHVAPLKDVAREVRGVLRRDRKLHAEEYVQRALYATLRDSLAAPGMRVRWAVFDTAAMRVPEPAAADLDRYYRGHLADYSSFDAASGGVVAKPLADVRDDVRTRFLRDARIRAARSAADLLTRAWAAGKRDAATEALTQVREAVAPEGADLDSTLEGSVVADSVWSNPVPRTSEFPLRGGWVVWQAIARVPRAVPSFAQARSALAAARQRQREAEELEGARALYETNAKQFSRGDVLSYTRIIVSPPPILQVPLTRAEVEQFHRENLDKYSAPELVRARHILIEPTAQTPEADAAARTQAEQVLARIRNGEDFGALAKQFSMDIATKDKGGDLGTFGRGTMLGEFERAAFSMQAGELVPDPVRTEVGWHVIQVLDHEPAVVQPLAWIYSSVSSDAAIAKAERMAQATADSMRRVARTPAALLKLAERLGYMAVPNQHKVGEVINSSAVRPFFQELEGLKAGQFVKEPFRMKGQGYWIAWVDSVAPPRTPTWDEARPYAIDAFRRGAGERAMNAKRAELDSMSAAGWAFDSLAALWGGPERTRELAPGKGLAGMGNFAIFDSLAFGTSRSPALPVGEVTGWVQFPNGSVRLRIAERVQPGAQQLAERAANIRAAETEEGLREYFEELKKRYPVKILEARMRDMQLASPPPGAPVP